MIISIKVYHQLVVNFLLYQSRIIKKFKGERERNIHSLGNRFPTGRSLLQNPNTIMTGPNLLRNGNMLPPFSDKYDSMCSVKKRCV